MLERLLIAAYRGCVEILVLASALDKAITWEINADGAFVEIRQFTDGTNLDSVVVFVHDKLSFSAHTTKEGCLKACFSDGINFVDLTIGRADLDQIMAFVFPSLMQPIDGDEEDEDPS